MSACTKGCHLNLTMNTVLIQNGSFISTADGQRVEVDTKVAVKLTGFGLSQFFKKKPPETSTSFRYFQCPSLVNEVQYQTPDVVNGEDYEMDARKADIWALGMMLYHCAVGEPLFERMYSAFEDPDGYKGSGYWAAMTGNVKQYVFSNNLQQFVNGKVLSLIHSLLKPKEKYRLNSLQVLQHQWFRKYYERYEQKMAQYQEQAFCQAKEEKNKQKQLTRKSVATYMAYR